MATKEELNTDRKNARWAGVFYIIATAAPISTIFFIGFLGGGVAGEPIPGYLGSVSANEGQVITGMFIEWIYALAVVGIIATLLPILRKQNEALALGFSGLRFIEVVCSIVGSISLLTLLTLSYEFVDAGAPGDSYFQTIGTVVLAIRDWAFMIGSGLVWSLSALVLNYLLYQSKLVPRWLSVWGILGALLSLVNYFPEFFGINSIDILFLPIALQEMVFAVWLIVKGVNSSANDSPSTKTEISGIM
ncbi:DUF4386 domain-containing protein [Chloroflexota bacterium]